MENGSKKIGFFSRLKIAVTKLEDYSMFLEEKTFVAVKYFFLVVLLVTVVMSVVETYGIMEIVNKGCEYIENELPDFSYENGNLQFSENVKAYDEKYDIYMIADTDENIAEEKIQSYRDEIKSTGMIFLKDKLLYKVGNDEVEYEYSEIASEYQIETLNKKELSETLNSVGGLTGILVIIFFIISFTVYIVQAISIFMDWLVIAIFAIIAGRTCKVNINFKNAFNISIYALTLPILFSLLYNIAYYLTGFYIEYFRVVYLLISYIYVVAAILMMKSDLLKQQMEVSKIIEVQKEVHEELNNPEDKKEQEPKENKKTEKEDKTVQENDIEGEPDGSEI